MQRRDVLRTFLALPLPGLLAACGGGSSASATPGGPSIDQLALDKPQYFVGESASVTAVFSGGNGRLDPGGIPVTSGVSVVLPNQKATNILRLTVTPASGNATITRDITITVAYRNILTSLSMGFGRASHVTAQSADGKLYAIGGEGGGSSLPHTVMAFDAYTEKFSLAGELSTGRTNHTATVLGDGSILIFGGGRSVSGTPIAERFDPVARTARATAGHPQNNRLYHSATLLADGRVLLVAGQVTGGSLISNTADIYDPAGEQFTRLPAALQYARIGHSATRLSNGKVLIYGGVDGAGNVRPPELFDPATQSFTTLPGLAGESIGRYRHIAVPVASSGDILIVGGEDFMNATPFEGVVRLAKDSNVASAAGKLLLPRGSLAAAPLLDGRILVAGGTRDTTSDALASTEVFSPLTGGSTAGPDMSTGRMFHTADVLATGKVLVIGGNDAGRGIVTTAELFS
ncbi:MAG: kelch repeat-containing protein [Sterolibacterium sp.]|jgi:hypothetical protein